MSERLNPDQIHAALSDLPGWEVRDGAFHHVIEVDGYRPAVGLAVRIAMEAEAANHHPDLLLTWGRVEITLVSHDVGGITDRDVALARTIAALPR
jgi:4a-hydroxytetrahydrobiopterin dehydratase